MKKISLMTVSRIKVSSFSQPSAEENNIPKNILILIKRDKNGR